VTPRILLTLCVVGSTIAVPVFGQWALLRTDADSLIRIGRDYIYGAKFDDARRAFADIIARYPHHPAGYFLDAMIEWWQMQLDRRNSRRYESTFLAKIDRVLALCDSILEENPYDIAGLFFKGGALGYRGRYYATVQSWLKAANDGRLALDILIKCNQLAPSNHDIMLGTGIYNYYAAALPEKYPVLKPIMVFLPSGDKRIGILQLEAAARSATYADIEAKVLLQQVYSAQFENQPHDYLRISQELYERYPTNPLFHRRYAVALLQVGSFDSSIAHWYRILDAYRTKVPYYDAYAAREALYYIGWHLYMLGKYDEALSYFYKCDEACRLLDEDPSGFMVKLNLYVGKIYDLQGKRDLAIMQYKKVLSWQDVQNSHAEAEQYLKTPYRK
jgi:tetratricopeptide (TPR) repeat protein